MSDSFMNTMRAWQEYRSTSDSAVWREAEGHCSNHSGRLDLVANWLYNGELGTVISNADFEMFDLIVRMLTQYHKHGENDRAFMNYAGEVNRRRLSSSA